MYYTSILVSITEVCTVGCRHCGFTGAVRERQASSDEIARWVAQACEYGIPEIIFTGGEPFQRFQLLKAGVKAAATHKPRPQIGVFTSSFWGKNPDAVDKLLRQLDGLSHLYLSTDIFHQERVPPQFVMNVIEGGIIRGIPDISLCITIADDREETQIRSLYSRFEGRVMVNVDRVIPTPFIDTARPPGHHPTPENFKRRCFLQTPLINPNGDLCSCHIGKVGAHQSLTDHAYYLGNLRKRSFQQIMSEANDNYEYQFLRAFGPQGVARLVTKSDSLWRRFGDRTFSNGCDLCSKVLLTKEGKQTLSEHVTDPFERELIDVVRLVRFGDAEGRDDE